MAKTQVIDKKKTAPVVEAVVVETPADPEVPTCQHHWVIESPRGALSSGSCKVCGEQREFRNSTTDYVWDDDSGKNGYSPWRGVRNTPARTVMSDDVVSTAAGSSQPMLAV